MDYGNYLSAATHAKHVKKKESLEAQKRGKKSPKQYPLIVCPIILVIV